MPTASVVGVKWLLLFTIRCLLYFYYSSVGAGDLSLISLVWSGRMEPLSVPAVQSPIDEQSISQSSHQSAYRVCVSPWLVSVDRADTWGVLWFLCGSSCAPSAVDLSRSKCHVRCASSKSANRGRTAAPTTVRLRAEGAHLLGVKVTMPCGARA